METLVTFVRHGKNNFVKDNTPWHPGPKLNKKGIEESELTGKYLKDMTFDMIFSSDMNRARQTAEIINKHQKPQKKNGNFDNIVFIRQLAEHDQTIYGKRPRRGRKKFDQELEKAEKTIKFFKRMLKDHKGEKILVVAHGNVIRACLGFSMGFELRKSPELNLFNCSVSTVIFKKNDLKSIFHINFADHCQSRKFGRKLSSVKFISDYSKLVNGKKVYKK